MVIVQEEIAKAVEAEFSDRLTVYREIVPEEDEPGPFIQVGYGLTNYQNGKNFRRGETELNVHLWHDAVNENDRFTEILQDLLKFLSRLEEVPGFVLVPQNMEVTTTKNVETSTTWLQGAINAKYVFAGY